MKTSQVLLLLILFLTLSAPGLAEWPQWRGPDGLGVPSGSEPLPETWEAGGTGIKWQVELPGEGISSPIVSNGKVFITTAYRDSRQERATLFLRGVAVLVAVALVPLLLRRPRNKPKQPGGWIERWDPRLVLAASCLLVLLALVAALSPDTLFPEGNPGRTWRNGGAIGLLGFAAAFGWCARDSKWRPMGALLTLLGAGFLLNGMPPGAPGSDSLSKGLPTIFLGLVLAAWYVFSYLRTRGEGRPTQRSSYLAVPLLLLAALVFVPANYLNGRQRAVVSLDLQSGEVLWQTSVLSGPPEQKWPNSSYATPTPVTDGSSVFAYFGHGLASVGLDGDLQWRTRFPNYAPNTRYGAGASPILTDSAVILVNEKEAKQGAPPSWIAAFDKASGDELWRIEPADAHDSYTTPLLYPTGSGAQLLTASWNALVGYDAETGERLWSYDYPMEQMVASIGRAGDLIALTGGAYGERLLLVLRLSGEGRETRAKAVWQTSQMVATIASPVIYDGMIFSVTTPGILTAWNAETGNQLWKKRLDGEHYASLVAGDGKLYATSVEGKTSVVAAASELRVIAENELSDRVFASPAIAGGCLLIRTASSLFCIDGRSGA